jgi:hypothetical protein
MSDLFEFSISLFKGDNMFTGGNVLYLYKSSPTSIKAKVRRICLQQYIFTKMLTYVITNILLLLRTKELCIFNSVSISGGQLIMYPQLIFKHK